MHPWTAVCTHTKFSTTAVDLVLDSLSKTKHYYAYENYYCRVDRDGTGASRPRGGRARDFVKFRKKFHASRARGASARV